jgi:hypothetical protein
VKELGDVRTNKVKLMRRTYRRRTMTKVVMMADRKTKPPKTPSAIIPPENQNTIFIMNERKYRII